MEVRLRYSIGYGMLKQCIHSIIIRNSMGTDGAEPRSPKVGLGLSL